MRDSEQLNKVGLRATGPRLKVLKVFENHERRHLTVEEVHRLMRERKQAVSLGTVYRALGQLTEVGILRRQLFDGERAVYELNQGGQHDHLICSECGRVEEFVDQVIEEHKQSVARTSGYAIVQHQHTLFGFCAQCRGALAR